MGRTISLINDVLEPRDKRRARFLLALCIPLAIAELAGLLGAIPFIMVAANPDNAQSHWLISRLGAFVGDVPTSTLLMWLGAGSIFIIILSVCFRTTYLYLITRFARDVGVSLQSRLLAIHLKRPQVQIRKRHGADIQSAVVVEAEEVVEEVILNALRVATYLCTAICILMLLVATDPVAGFAMLTLISVGYIAVFGTTRRVLRRMGQGRLDMTRERHRLLQEAVGGQRELQLAQREDAAVARFSRTAATLGALRARMTFIKEVPRGFLEVLIFGSMILLSLWLIQSNADRGAAILPVIAIYALAAARLFPVLQRLYKAVVAMQATAPGLRAVKEELGDYATLQADGDAAAIPLTSDIRLEDVTFSYPDTPRKALSSVTLDIKAQSVVGFVGETGAGKSTAVDLLLGLLSPDSGRVCVDQTEITADNRRGWQKSVGYVPQDIFLTDGTIAENIAFGHRGAEIDPVALARVIAQAGLSRFISNLREGVDTQVGERGVRLSGGERQRIGIARGLYHNPDLLVFDEATSALDTITELSVMREIRAMGAEKTIVIVAHRLSTVRACDKIFLFDSGGLAASGTYETLLGQSDHFRALHEACQ